MDEKRYANIHNEVVDGLLRTHIQMLLMNELQTKLTSTDLQKSIMSGDKKLEEETLKKLDNLKTDNKMLGSIVVPHLKSLYIP